jgi:ribosome-binding protein aMBF1 (putative translation factor)
MAKRIRDEHGEWIEGSAYRKAYAALADELDLAAVVVIEARMRAGLSQAALAKRIGTKQPAIARIEGGQLPSTATLQRIAKATGTRLRIALEPVGDDAHA